MPNRIGCSKDCPNRHPGCHDTCETYLAARAEREKKYEQRAKKSILTGDLEAVYQKPRKLWAHSHRR